MNSEGEGEGAARVVLADDHRMLREGLRRCLEDCGIEVVGEAADGEEAVALAEAVRPDVVLMDLSMPVLGGIEAIRRIREGRPEVRVVVLTMHSDHAVLAQAIRAGAVGYLVKEGSTEELVTAVRVAARGEAVLSPALAASMLDEVRRMPAPSDDEPLVSRREEEVLQLVADGLSTAEIAARLFISVKTVKNHLASIYQKLDSRDRTQAVLRAVRMGIVQLR